MIFLLLLQASPAAPTASPEAWVAIGLATVSTVGTVLVALIQRNTSGKKEDVASELAGMRSTLQGCVAGHAEFKARLDAVEETIDAGTDPELRRRDSQHTLEKIVHLESELREQKAKAERRAEDEQKANADISKQLARIGGILEAHDRLDRQRGR